MKQIRVLHIAEIDNNLSKGTSVIIPQYINEQDKKNKLYVGFLNCNNIKIDCIEKTDNIYHLNDNKNMNVINNFNPDIVVFHEIYKPYYIRLYRYLIKKQIPYIIIPHGGLTIEAQKQKKLKKIIGNLIFFKKFFYNAIRIQYLSEIEKNNSLFKKLPSYVIGNGINNIPTKNMYLSVSRNKKTFDIIYVGRYDIFIKGLDQLLEASKILKNNNFTFIKIKLFGIGSNEDIKTIQDFIEENQLEKNVYLNGPIFSQKKRKEIILNDVFIQVSRTEGQPLGVMEAIALGMPVILSSGTGYEKIVKEYELGRVTRTNAKNIYNSIISMYLNRKSLSSYSRNSYEYALNNYSWNTIVDMTINKYIELINR